MNLSSYLPLLAELMLKSAVLFGVALAAAWFGRQVSAANRHLIWLAAFGQVLALPFLTAWLSGDTGPAPVVGGTETALVLTLPAEKAQTTAATPMRPVAEPASPLRSVLVWARAHWRDGVVATWLGVAGALLVWRLVGAARLRLLKRRSRAVHDARIEVWVALIAAEQGLRRSMELRTSSECPVAMTWGTWRPVVMLPAEAPAWSEKRLELVLRHELAHVARRDCLVRLLSQMACAFYWPNPLVWLGARRLRLAQEQACDDRVLATGAEAGAYAEELLAGAWTLSGRRWAGAAVAMAEPSTLEKRIVGIVDAGRDRGGAHRLTMIFAGVAAALALVGCTELQVRSAQDASAVKTKRTGPVRQVEIAVRYLDTKGMPVDAYLDRLKDSGGRGSLAAPVVGYLPGSRADAEVRELRERMGVDLLSSPRVTVLDGNRASVTVAHELRYPVVWGRMSDGLSAVPKEFDTREIGVSLDVIPKIAADSDIELDLHCLRREFEGFVQGQIDASGRLVPIPSTAPVFIPDDSPALPVPVSARGAVTPVFSEQEATTSVRLHPGETVVLRLGDRRSVAPAASGDWAAKAVKPGVSEESCVLVFVTATEVLPRGIVPGGKPPPLGTTTTPAAGGADPFRF